MTKKQHNFWFWMQLVCALLNALNACVFYATHRYGWMTYCLVCGGLCLALTIRHYLALRRWCDECDQTPCMVDEAEEAEEDEDDGF